MAVSHFYRRVLRRTGTAAMALAALAAVVVAEPARGEVSTPPPTRARIASPTLVPPDRGWTQGAPAAAAEPSGSVPASVDIPFSGLDESLSGARVANPAVAANSTTVLQAANHHVRLTNVVGGNAKTVSLEQFFGASPALGPVIQPKAYFDRNAANQRFYVVAAQNANTENNNPGDDLAVLHLAISRSLDPSDLSPSNWCRYELDGLYQSSTTNNQPVWGTFPSLGAGADGLVITTNHFQLVNNQNIFALAIARALDKSFYSDNEVSCPSGWYWELEGASTLSDMSAEALQPAQHYNGPTSFPGKTNPVYLVSARATASSNYRVWRIANIAPFNAAAPPVLESVTVSWSTYSPPPSAPGGAGGTKIDTGRSSILQTAGVGDAITAVHTIACQFTANTPLESCFRAVRFVVGDVNGALTVTKSDLQGLGGGDNAFYHHPGIAVNNSHQTVVVFLANMPANSHRISSKVALKPLGGAFGASMTLTDGTCSRAPAAGFSTVAAGHYTGAQTSTDGITFWVSAEHAGLDGAVCRWKTSVAEVIP